jgi:hypothetical protein
MAKYAVDSGGSVVAQTFQASLWYRSLNPTAGSSSL